MKDCNKNSLDYQEAHFVAQTYRNKRLRIYYCDQCFGYHLTKQKPKKPKSSKKGKKNKAKNRKKTEKIVQKNTFNEERKNTFNEEQYKRDMPFL